MVTAGRRRIPERAPLIAVLLALIGVAFFAIPLAGLLWKARWSTAWDELTKHEALQALRLSIVTSVAATGVALLLGVPLAWVQARLTYPGKRLVRALTTLPMVLPPVVGGIAMLYGLGRAGLAGRQLDAVGVHLPFSTAGAVAAEAFVAMPFLVLAVEAGFRSTDRGLEDAARTLGARRFRVFRQVTLPLARPAVVTGGVLCWARALGEFGATITFAGNLPGKTQTLPLFVYVRLESGDADAAIVLSLVLLAISVVVLVALRERWAGALWR